MAIRANRHHPSHAPSQAMNTLRKFVANLTVTLSAGLCNIEAIDLRRWIVKSEDLVTAVARKTINLFLRGNINSQSNDEERP